MNDLEKLALGSVEEIQLTLEVSTCNCERLENKIAALEKTLEKYSTLRSVEEWHEDFGTALWWHLPICEPPFVGGGPGSGDCYADGNPTICARLIDDGWLTHWTPIMEPGHDE